MTSQRFADRQLPTASPSAVGVDPSGLNRFVQAATEQQLDPHSLVLMRHGRVFAESYWRPYSADGVQLLYSLSKSFTASAVALAVGEGRFSLGDRVVDLLAGHARLGVGAGVGGVRVRDLLAMASGHAEDTIAVMLTSDDPVAAVLAEPLDAEPGTLFTYNQGCTYLLSAIIGEHTGEQLSQYLRPRLFDPLGIGDVRWRETDGLEQGFSGLHARTRDVAALGQLYLQDGRWGDTQLLPEGWVTQASSVQVATEEQKTDPDWQQGYGFHLWRCQHDCYRGDGAFGQFMVVVPWADLVIAVTSQTERMQAMADLFWQHLLPAVDADRPLAVDGRPDSGPHSAPDARGNFGSAWTRTFDVPSPASRSLDVPIPTPGSWTFEPRAAQYVDLSTVQLRQPTAEGEAAATGRSAGETGSEAECGVASAGEAGGAADVAMLDLTWRSGEQSTLIVGQSWRRAEWKHLGPNGRRARIAADCMVAGGWEDAETFSADIIFFTTPHRLRLTCRLEDGVAEVKWVTVPL